MRRILTATTLAAIIWGASMGAAEARDPTPVPGDYPTTGPTPTTTVPVAVTYPETTPTPTTTVPPTTTTEAPTPTPTTTAPPRTPTPRPEPATTDEDETVEAESTIVITDDLVTMYELADEHETLIVQAAQPGAEIYTVISAPDGAEVGTTGTVRYTPPEAAGGTTVVIQLAGERGDGSMIRITIRVLVTETNDAPEITPPAVLRGFPGKTVAVEFLATDTDLPGDTLAWSVDGPPGMSIDDGVLVWAVADDAEPATIPVVVTVRDDGEPVRSHRLALDLEIIDTSDAAVAAVDAEGRPVNPMVLAAGDGIEPMMVNLDEPGELMLAVAERTPKGAVRSFGPKITTGRGPIESSAVVRSVQQTFDVLLRLDVPTTAVASGLMWQFALLSLPSLLGRRRALYDIVGVGPGHEIGDDTFRFRSNATGLPGGALRRRDGVWMRAIASPRGAVWIPRANLRPSEAGR